MALWLLLGLTGIGVLIGLLGGGGSLLLVPLLVDFGGYDLKHAIASSLLVVGVTSLIAALRQASLALVCWRNGLAFGLSGMLGAYAGGRLAGSLEDGLLLMLFAAMMLITAAAMLIGRRPPTQMEAPAEGQPCPTRINLPGVLFDGLLVGLVTGLVGVGGGFVIVPALNLLGGLALRAAIGTSQLVVGMNSFAALSGYLGHLSLDLRASLWMLAVTVPLSLIGQHWARAIPAKRLRRYFGLFALIIATLLFRQSLEGGAANHLITLLVAHEEFVRGLLTPLAIFLVYWTRGLLHQRALKPPPPGH